MKGIAIRQALDHMAQAHSKLHEALGVGLRARAAMESEMYCPVFESPDFSTIKDIIVEVMEHFMAAELAYKNRLKMPLETYAHFKTFIATKMED